jgi:hypothetical protein
LKQPLKKILAETALRFYSPTIWHVFLSFEAIMNRLTFFFWNCAAILGALLCATAFTACAGSGAQTSTTKPGASASTAALPTLRIAAGRDEAFKDSQGTLWAADTGSDGGETNDRTDLQITGSDRPDLYQAERYGMNSYTFKVPNGNYTVKLHFSEDYDGITDPTMRIFTYAVKDGDAATGKTLKEVKDFSPWKAAGAEFKAYVDTIPVTVNAGQISIVFTAQVENPQINAIEIVPH